MWSKSIEILDPFEALSQEVSDKSRKPRKKRWPKVKAGIQLFLLVLFAHLGMTFLLACAWHQLELPVDWWTSWVMALLGAVLTWGLFEWIGRSEYGG